MHDFHVCVLTSAHPQDDVRVHERIVPALRDAGFRVSWVGPDHFYFNPTAREQAAYDGVDRFLFPKPSRLGRLWGRDLSRTAAKPDRPDVYFCPDPDSARLAIRLARRTGAKVVFDVHELYHDAHIANWAPAPLLPLARRTIQHLINGVCKHADLVIGVSEGVLDPYRDNLKESLILRNCATRDWGGETKTNATPRRDELRLMHGKNAAYNGTPAVLEAIAELQAEIPHVKAVMIQWFDQEGPCSETEFHRTVQRLDIEDSIELTPPVSRDAMRQLLAGCDVGLISHGRQLAAGTQPNRAFEYMAFGLPVIAPAFDRGIAPVIGREECGLLVDTERPGEIARAIVQLHRNADLRRQLAVNGRQAFLERHNWDAEVQPLIERFRQWAAVARPGRVAA